MVRGIRTALLWLILFALPLHGFAGGAMLRCVGIPMSTSQPSGPMASGTDIDRGAGAAPIASAQPAPADCGMAARGYSPQSLAGHCLAAAACDIVAAPAPRALAFVVPAASAAAPLPRLSIGVFFFTDAPYRPPSILA